MSRLPIRVRLTLGFALAMAVVLAAVGLFVYRRVANELLRTVDQTLVAQSQEEIRRAASVDADTGSGPTLAQLFDARGTAAPVAAAGLGTARGTGRSSREAATGQRCGSPTQLPGQTGEWRVLARPAPARERRRGLARSLDSRSESLDHLRHELLVFLPLALLAASLGGYALAAGALRPVEVLRRRAEAVTAGEPSQAAGAAGGRRGRRGSR